MEKIIGAIVDNDTVVKQEIYFHKFRVVNLQSVFESIDGIIITPMIYHEIVYERVQSFIAHHGKNRIKVINLFGYNTNDEMRQNINYIENHLN